MHGEKNLGTLTSSSWCLRAGSAKQAGGRSWQRQVGGDREQVLTSRWAEGSGTPKKVGIGSRYLQVGWGKEVCIVHECTGEYGRELTAK